MKLNVGCFNKKMHGFVNVDIRPECNPDRVDDAFKLETFENSSADLIYCCHCLEHLSFTEVKLALKRYYEVLRPRGIVRLAVPNVAAAVEHYIYHRNLKDLYSAFWGSQRHDYDFHRSGFDEATLTQYLEEAGFRYICLYDRWKTEHAYVDDYSAAYFPHLDFTEGKLMSLNMEGIKP